MSRRLGKYAAIFSISLASAAAYLGDVLGSSAFFVLIVFILSRVWKSLLGPGHASGFSHGELVWYVVFTESLLLSVPRFEQTVEEDVRSGSVAYLMVRPVDYLGHHLAAFAGAATLKLGLNLAVGAALALAIGGPPPTPLAALPWVLAAAALGLALHFHVTACMALLAFWVEETRPFFWIYQKILFTAGGLLIPLEFFPGWLRGAAEALPFASILYAPARLAVHYDAGTAMVLIRTQILWVLFFFVSTRAIWSRATRQLALNGG